MTTFCILAAGRGTRTNDITSLHKCLLNINNKAVISHIIEKAPLDSEIVIAIGHQKEIIKEYCQAAHPDRTFIFVEVDNFDKPGSGPGYSLSCCRNFLQRPFYLICSDCIIIEDLPNLDHNWIGVFPVKDPQNWSTAKVDNGKVTAFTNKSNHGYEQAFIGVAGIKDYEIFWTQMNKGQDKEFEMVSAFYSPEVYPELLAIPLSWYDTGTAENYNKTKKKLSLQMPLGMSKEINEVTYKINDRCIKVFDNKKTVAGRMERAKFLKGLIPEIVFKGENVYAYKWVEGLTLYESNSLEAFHSFLNWCKDNLWKKVEVPYSQFNKLCYSFYKEKTFKRVDAYLNKKKITDRPLIINGVPCDTIMSYLESIDWDWLSTGLPSNFHGDLQFENIINNETNYYLIDWRDGFANTTEYGDLYYDLAKLNAGLSMSFHSIKYNKFRYEQYGPIVNYEFEIPSELHRRRFFYENWLLSNHFDLMKVRFLTALIYLNMSPLHTSLFDEMLFQHSKFLLDTLFLARKNTLVN